MNSCLFAVQILAGCLISEKIWFFLIFFVNMFLIILINMPCLMVKKGEEIGFRITNEAICNLSGGSARNVNRKYRK
jgi:uncharacterized membrane protein YoaT (DUF817 family)